MKYLRYTALYCVLFVVLFFAQSSFAGQTKPLTSADDFRITHHERLNNLFFQKSGATQKSAKTGKASPATQFSFDAYGRRFDIELEPNNELMANLPKIQKSRLKQSMRVYKGRIPGIEGSWARISRIGKRLSGAIWDGNDLYLIDSSDEVKKALSKERKAGASKAAYPLIYKMSEIETSATCALEGDAKPLNKYNILVKELQEKALALPQASRQLDVAIIADANFTQANSANPQAAVIARMNVVDGIYSGQVGVHLNISEIRALTNNGALSSTNSSTLLNQFVGFTRPPAFNNPGLAHLFSGRDLDGNIVGIAYIGVLCRKDVGVGLSQIGGMGTAGALTVAHEMGHNFGAPHDNQSGACASTPGNFIMNPSLNGSTQFSSCSLGQMSPRIAGAACITGIAATPSADVRPVIPVNPINVTTSSSFKYSVEVRNGGTGTAQNSTVRISVPTALTVSSVVASVGQCSASGGTVNCNLGALAANAVSTITLNVQSGVAPGSVTSSVQVGATNDSNTGNNSANVAINVSSNNTTATSLFQSDFNANAGDFIYTDDAFLATRQPAYELGDRVVNAGSGQLRVVLGGADNAFVTGMSGGWRKSFTLNAPKQVTLSFDYQLTQAANYEADEYSDALLALDGRLIGVNGGSFLFRIAGDGNGGAARSSGIKHVDVDLGTVAAGNHTITLGGFNSKKTYVDESTTVFFDNVKAVTKP